MKEAREEAFESERFRGRQLPRLPRQHDNSIFRNIIPGLPLYEDKRKTYTPLHRHYVAGASCTNAPGNWKATPPPEDLPAETGSTPKFGLHHQPDPDAISITATFSITSDCQTCGFRENRRLTSPLRLATAQTTLL